MAVGWVGVDGAAMDGEVAMYGRNEMEIGRS